MKRLVLIDPSLQDLGGHHFLYAHSVLQAAQVAGLQTVLATHTCFRDFQALPPGCTVHAVFTDKSRWPRPLDLALAAAARRPALAGAWARVWRRLRWGQERSTARFAAGCQALFERVTPASGDIVFIATSSPLDFVGLARFLRTNPASRRASWHLQFHLPLFRGREPDYSSQESTASYYQARFRDALACAREHALHFYCTTPQLTAQYERLGVARFTTLPYPVHPIFRVRSPRTTAMHEPVRLALLGHARREKGYDLLPQLVRDLWTDQLRDGRAQLVLQTHHRVLRRALRRQLAALRNRSLAATPVPAIPVPPIRYASYPLPLKRYAELIHEAGVGLLLYDAEHYYTRCSGILLEMLTAGIPVIVPAGCWLSEQIEAENQRYLVELALATPALRTLGESALQWPDTVAETETLPGPVCVAGRTAVVEMLRQAGESTLLCSFRMAAPAPLGTYLRIELQQFDAAGVRLAGLVTVAAPRAPGLSLRALFRLDAQAVRVRLRWNNAWSRTPLSIHELECRLFAERDLPAGVVGLAAYSTAQVAPLLQDLLANLAHYQRGARLFAARCAQYYNADQVLRGLLSAVDEGQAVKFRDEASLIRPGSDGEALLTDRRTAGGCAENPALHPAAAAD